MNHRCLLSVVSSWFGVQNTPPTTQTTPIDWIPRDVLAGRAFTAGSAPSAPIGDLTVIVRRSGSAIAAERSRLALLAQAGEVQKGMGIHATHVIGQSLPPHLTLLPGSLVTWDTVAGAPAFRRSGKPGSPATSGAGISSGKSSPPAVKRVILPGWSSTSRPISSRAK